MSDQIPPTDPPGPSEPSDEVDSTAEPVFGPPVASFDVSEPDHEPEASDAEADEPDERQVAAEDADPDDGDNTTLETEATSDIDTDAATWTSGGAWSDDELLDAAATPPDDDGDPVGERDRGPASSEPSGSDAGDGGPPPLFAPAATRSPYRRLFRSRNDRRLGGVAGGIAQYLGIDPTVVRIGFVVFALTGVSILIYLAAWILVPEHPGDTPEAMWTGGDDNDRRLALAVGVGGLGLAIAIITGSWAVLALGLVAGGVWLLSEGSGPRPPQPPQPPSPPSDGRWTSPAAPPAASGVSSSGAAATAVAPPPTWADPQPPRPPRRAQRITRVVLSLLALLIALGTAAAAGDWWNVSATRMFGIGIVIIGVGVAAGAVTRLGARGLIPLGIVATLLLVPVAAVDGLVDDGVGESIHRPTTIDDLANEYQYGIGHLVVDLTQLDFEGRNEAVHIELGIGEVEVLIPDDVGGSVIAEADAGEIDVRLNRLFDRSDDGLNVDSGQLTLLGDRGQLELTVEVGLGSVDVRTR